MRKSRSHFPGMEAVPVDIRDIPEIAEGATRSYGGPP